MIAKSEEPSLSLVEASIDELQRALSTGIVTCVTLVAAYLERISTFDYRGPSLNSIPLLNPRVFDEAAASDQRRAAGETIGPLDGIPFTVKDSYKVKGQTVACGSLAFQDLIANEDAFTVQKLREAGAVLIGRTNMCPMAAGGMQRGIYGRAESPYNERYLAAAFASGSSNGSGVSTAASFAAFGMGEETVSSGRSPASNNALVAYTPSRGAISIRGNWPLYPTCDVVVPHTRSMDDLFCILDIITAPDHITKGDFWRDQPFVELANPWSKKRPSSCDLAQDFSLQGLRIAVPSMYINGINPSGSDSVHTSPHVRSLYQVAKLDLERLGATVVEVDDFPVIRKYELANNFNEGVPPSLCLPDGWNSIERSLLIARAWEQFLTDNNDFNISSLKQVDQGSIYPQYPADDPQIRYTEPMNRIQYEKFHSLLDSSNPTQKDKGADPRTVLMSTPNLQAAIKSLEEMRKRYFEDWLELNSFDMVVFPACGDVGKSDADINYASAEHAWRNGVKYSNGNRALRHLGIPSVTVPMGNMADKDMPVGLTFLSKAGDDMKLLQRAHVYEKISKRRSPPRRAQALGPGRDVFISHKPVAANSRRAKPELKVEKCTATRTSQGMVRVHVEGFVVCAKSDNQEEPHLDILIDAQPVPKQKVTIQRCHGTVCSRPMYDFRCSFVVPGPPRQDDRNRVMSRRKIARDSTMVVVTTREGKQGWSSGFLKLL